MNERATLTKLAEVLRPISRPEPVTATKQYNILGARWYARGLYVPYPDSVQHNGTERCILLTGQLWNKPSEGSIKGGNAFRETLVSLKKTAGELAGDGQPDPTGLDGWFKRANSGLKKTMRVKPSATGLLFCPQAKKLLDALANARSKVCV
jgi:hypothetical protein